MTVQYEVECAELGHASLSPPAQRHRRCCGPFLFPPDDCPPGPSPPRRCVDLPCPTSLTGQLREVSRPAICFVSVCSMALTSASSLLIASFWVCNFRMSPDCS